MAQYLINDLGMNPAFLDLILEVAENRQPNNFWKNKYWLRWQIYELCKTKEEIIAMFPHVDEERLISRIKKEIPGLRWSWYTGEGAA